MNSLEDVENMEDVEKHLAEADTSGMLAKLMEADASAMLVEVERRVVELLMVLVFGEMPDSFDLKKSLETIDGLLSGIREKAEYAVKNGIPPMIYGQHSCAEQFEEARNLILRKDVGAIMQVLNASRYGLWYAKVQAEYTSSIQGMVAGRVDAEAEVAAREAETRAKKFEAQGLLKKAEAERKKAKAERQKAKRAKRDAESFRELKETLRDLQGMEGRLTQTVRETGQSVVVQVKPGKGGKSGKPRRVYLPETLLDAFRDYEKRLQETPKVNQMILAADTVEAFKENGRDLGMGGPAFRKLYNIWVQGKRPQQAEEWEAVRKAASRGGV